jgi:dihydropteroate synthase
LVGISRKSFIYKPLGLGPEDVLTATQLMNMAALERGADILRVHDVAAARETLALYRLLHGVSGS